MKIEMNQQEFEQVFSTFTEGQREVGELRSRNTELSDKVWNLQDKVRSLETENKRLSTQVPMAQGDYSVNLARFSAVCEAINAGQKINAIKLVREMFGCGLKEAKDCVEGSFHRYAKVG